MFCLECSRATLLAGPEDFGRINFHTPVEFTFSNEVADMSWFIRQRFT
jgi:hypothetical protein